MTVLLVRDGAAIEVVAYDDPATDRPGRFLPCDNADNRLATGWFDRSGIRRLPVDRAVLDGVDKLAGLFIPIKDEAVGARRMLKITRRDDPGSIVFELEGRLAGPWVDELGRCWRQAAADGGCIAVELKEITFIDAAGQELLAEMHRQGTRLGAVGCMTKAVVEEIMAGGKT